jgi:hypothetical protein
VASGHWVFSGTPGVNLLNFGLALRFCHYYLGEHNNSEKPEKREKTRLKYRKEVREGGSMLKRELCSPRNKKNGEGKQKSGKSRK